MEYSEYESEVERLTKVYGKNLYPPERLKIMYDIFKKDSRKLFANAVTELIANYKNAPMVNEIANAIGKARERESAEATRRENELAADMLSAKAGSIFAKDDIRSMLSMLYKKMARQITKKEFDEYMSSVSDYVKKSGKNYYKCQKCSDTGRIVHTGKDGNDYVWRCSCEKGLSYRSLPDESGTFLPQEQKCEQKVTYQKQHNAKNYGRPYAERD
jgi:hypothetical protein